MIHEARFAFILAALMVCGACGSEGPGSDAQGDGAAVCGDGVKDAGEACDDGNRVAGDGCSPECVLSGTSVECVTLLEGGSQNAAHALLPLANREFMAAGEQWNEGVSQGWIGRFDGSGQPLWFESIIPTTAAYGRVVGLVTDGQNGAWALVEDGARTLLTHFDEAGSSETGADIGAQVGIPLALYTLEYGDTSVWLGGESWGDFWLGRYDLASNTVETLLLEDHLGFKDAIRALGRSPTQIAFAATLSASPNADDDFLVTATTDILFGRFDLQGNELGRTLWSADPESQLARIAERVVFQAPDRWFIGGGQASVDPTLGGQQWLGRVLPAPNWSWTSFSVLGEQGGAHFGGILAVEGDLVMAGGVYRGQGSATQVKGWLAGFGREGESVWQKEGSTRGYDHYEEQEIALDSEGRLRVVGKAWTAGGPLDEDGASLLKSCIVAR